MICRTDSIPNCNGVIQHNALDSFETLTTGSSFGLAVVHWSNWIHLAFQNNISSTFVQIAERITNNIARAITVKPKHVAFISRSIMNKETFINLPLELDMIAKKLQWQQVFEFTASDKGIILMTFTKQRAC